MNKRSPQNEEVSSKHTNPSDISAQDSQKNVLQQLEQELAVRKQTEEALRQSEQRFRSIVNSTPMGIHLYRLDDDDRLIFCGANPAADAILGIDHQALIGQTLEETFPSLRDTDIPQRYRQICSEGRSWKSGLVDYQSLQINGSFEIHAFQTDPNMMAIMFMNITEREKIQKELVKSEERFRSFFEFSAAAIGITTPQGKYLQVNPTGCRLLGYTEQEFQAMTILDITHQDDRKLAMAQFKELIEGKRQVLDYENRYLHKNGSIVWGHSIASCVRDVNQQILYIAGQVVDITARKQAEFELQSANQRLQNIIEFLPDAILGQTNYAVALSGKQELMLIDQIGASDTIICTSLYDFVEQEGETLFAERFLPALNNGEGLHVWIKASPLRDSQGNLIGAIESIRDITARKCAEDKLIEANIELATFVNTVSHDLRTPLTPIIGYAEFLQQNYREKLDEQALQYLDNILRSGEKMLAIMDDLLKLATVRQIKRPEHPIETKAIVEQVVDDLTEQRVQTGAKVTIDNLPAVQIPDTLLALLFDNLISNAIRYGCQQGDTVTVGGTRQAEWIKFYVRDHGPGIAAVDQGRIFEVFYRGTLGTQHEGTGIGLATVQKIAKLFEGRVWSEETPGGGSTFWVELKDDPV